MINSIFSPITLTFIIVILGMLLGRVKIREVSFGLSGVLIIAVLVGYIISRSNVFLKIDADFTDSMKMISNFGTSLFVSAVGISTGYSLLHKRDASCVKPMLIGASMVIIAGLVVFAISKTDMTADKSVLMGVLCGALTTTPGLASVNEIAGVDPALASAGYGCAYLFGVISIVMYVQYSTKEMANTDTKKRIDGDEKGGLGIILISIVIVLGRLFGEISFPFLKTGIGTSSGLLIVGMFSGYITGKISKIKKIDERVLEFLKTFGLLLFFVGNGVPAGIRLIDVFNARYFCYGAVISILTLFFGNTLCALLKCNSNERFALLSGGMTSTPAFVSLCNRLDGATVMQFYSMAYIGALMTVTIGTKFLWLIM